jgi:hypothetical protein
LELEHLVIAGALDRFVFRRQLQFCLTSAFIVVKVLEVSHLKKDRDSSELNVGVLSAAVFRLSVFHPLLNLWANLVSLDVIILSMLCLKQGVGLLELNH